MILGSSDAGTEMTREIVLRRQPQWSWNQHPHWNIAGMLKTLKISRLV